MQVAEWTQPARGASPTGEPVPTVAGFVTCFAVATYSVLALIVSWQTAGPGVWLVAFAVPVALTVAAGYLGYRFIYGYR